MEFKLELKLKATPKVTFEMVEDEASRSVLSGDTTLLDLKNLNYDSLTVKPNNTDDLSEKFIAETLKDLNN
jgi:hypothetical protein